MADPKQLDWDGTHCLGGGRDVYLDFHEGAVVVDGYLTAAELREIADHLERKDALDAKG